MSAGDHVLEVLRIAYPCSRPFALIQTTQTKPCFLLIYMIPINLNFFCLRLWNRLGTVGVLFFHEFDNSDYNILKKTVTSILQGDDCLYWDQME